MLSPGGEVLYKTGHQSHECDSHHNTLTRSCWSATTKSDAPMDIYITNSLTYRSTLWTRECTPKVLLTKWFILEVIRACDKAGLDSSETPILLRKIMWTTRQSEWLVITVEAHTWCLGDIIRNGQATSLISNQSLITTVRLYGRASMETGGQILQGGGINLYELVHLRTLCDKICIICANRQSER